MATWNAPLPDEAHAGDSGHVADHNALVAALTEIRTEVDKKGTSNLALGTTATTAKAGNYTPTTAEVANALKAKTQISALNGVIATATAAAGDTPTKAEFDALVTLANANKAAIGAIVAALKA